MKVRHCLPLVVAAAALVAHLSIAQGWRVAPVRPPAPRPVDLVICLDTSGSMTQLIDSARAKLWDVVNIFSGARPRPRLRVGLLTYGSPNLSTAARGWVVRQIDLTDDLDAVYARMMAMRTNGGDEYVGWVLNDAVKTMSWSPEPKALKMIFVAGNESADQAAHQFNFRYVAELARAHDITVSPIYCGPNQQGIREAWDQVALYGGGSYTAIDMQRGTVQITTPYDAELIKLDVELNATYIPYGGRGQAGRANQAAQDANAAALGRHSRTSRAVTKALDFYRNESWDLIDALDRKTIKIEEIQTEDLPPEMRSMSMAERRSHVEHKRVERRQTREKTRTLSAKRQKHLRKQRADAAPGQESLDDAMRKDIRKKAREKGFSNM